MPQYESNSTFYMLPQQAELREFLLLLRAQDPTDQSRWWTAGTAFFISDRLAISAAHIFHAFERLGDPNRMEREARLGHLGPVVCDGWTVFQDKHPIPFDLIQFTSAGEQLRWAIESLHYTGSCEFPEFDSDLALLFLKPHPNCEAALSYVLPKKPRLQLFPPGVGQKIFVCGWPDNPNYEQGCTPTPLIEGDFFFVSEDRVTELATTNLNTARFKYPHFISEARSYSGMSGGPVLIEKPNGFVICGLHTSAMEGLSRHSILWTMLSTHIDHPVGGRCRLLHLVNDHIINAPCGRYFSLRNVGSFTEIKCSEPELWLEGTYGGRIDWIVESHADVLLQLLGPAARAQVPLDLAHSVRLSDLPC